MSTIVLGKAGAAIGALAGPGGAFLGQMVGSAIGAYLDSRLLTNGNGQDRVSPNRDMRVQASEEGAQLPTIFGKARVPCTAIWTSEIRETDNSNGSGKGGTGGNYITYTYSCDIAYAYAAHEVEVLEEVFANGKRLYALNPDINFTAFNPDEGAISHTQKYVGQWFGGPAWQYTYYLELSTDDPNFPLDDITTGAQATMSGWTGAYTANNGTFDVWQVRYDDALDASFVKFRIIGANVAVGTPAANPFVTYTPGTQSITIYQTNQQFSPKQLAGISVYNGTEDQPVDATIEALEILNGAPAFRGIGYFVIQDFQLTDYGNVPPAQMEALVTRKTAQTVQEAIETICADAGLSADEVDASACTAECEGFFYLGAQPAANALESLLIAYDIIKQERDGVVYFFPRADATDVAVDDDDLACHLAGDDAPRDVKLTDGSAFDLPREVTVLYKDPDRKYQTGAQRVRRAFTRSDLAQTIDLNATLSSSAAHAIAARTLWLAHVNSRRCRFQVPPKHLGEIMEGTRVGFTAHGQPMTILVDQVDRGENFVLDCEGVFEDPRILAQPAISDFSAGGDSIQANQNVTGTQNQQWTPPFPSWEILDVCSLSDRHSNTPGFYFAACFPGDRMSFSGVSLYESTDEGTTFNEIARATFAATMGHADTAMSGAVSASLWDDVSVLDVTLEHGTLESVTDLQCQDGANRAIVGGELIGFATATLIAAGQYRLTRILRGLQGTEDKIADHAIGESFVCVTLPGVEFVPINLAAVGQDRIYKCVPFGGIMESFESVELGQSGATVRPLRPVNVTATRNGSNDVTFSWTRRSRKIGRLFSEQPAPVDEVRSSWYVEVLDEPTGLDVVRTSALSSTSDTVSSAAYTAAQQTADGYTPGDPINVRITPASDWLGRGALVEATV